MRFFFFCVCWRHCSSCNVLLRCVCVCDCVRVSFGWKCVLVSLLPQWFFLFLSLSTLNNLLNNKESSLNQRMMPLMEVYWTLDLSSSIGINYIYIRGMFPLKIGLCWCDAACECLCVCLVEIQKVFVEYYNSYRLARVQFASYKRAFLLSFGIEFALHFFLFKETYMEI